LHFDRTRIIITILFCAGIYLFFVTIFSRSLADNDLWGYLAFGRIFWEDGYFPFHDIFSYTPTKPVWVYHEWLTGVLFYGIYKCSGPAGLQLARYIVIVLTIYLVYLTAVKKGGRELAAVTALVPAMFLISFGYVPVRAQIFTFFFFILTINILENAKKNQNWSILWWLLPIQILWCNLHGGFIAGLGLIVLYALGEGLSNRISIPYIKFGFLATLVTLANPYGIEYWLYLIPAITMPRPDIGEWMSVIAAVQNHFQELPVFIFLFMAQFCAIIFLFSRKKDLTDFFVLAVTIYLGCKHVRHNIMFGLAFGAYVPVMLSGYWDVWKMKDLLYTRRSWIPKSMFSVLLLSLYLVINPSLSLTLVPSFALLTPSPLFPAGAVNWMRANDIRGNILPHFDWGEYLIWTCHPYCRVAMDGRYETIYDEQVSNEYFNFLNGREGWQSFLRKYPHDMVLIQTNTRIHQLMLKETAWRLAYAGQGTALFMKNENRTMNEVGSDK